MIAETDYEYKPHLHLTDDDFPAIKKYDVGDSYSAIIKCKMVEKRDEHGHCSGEFVILSIKETPKDKNKVKDLMGY